MREIVFNAFDIDGLRQEARRLETLSERMEEIGQEICRRLAEIGVEVASLHYANGWIDGNNEVEVTTRPTENGCAIVASGEDVFFLEFGTGVSAGNGYDTSEITPPVSIEPGSWSETHSKQFSEKGYWHYGGRRFIGTAPRMGMYHAAKEVQEQAQRIAQEVINDRY